MPVLNAIDRFIIGLALANAWLMLMVMIGVRVFDIVARKFMATPAGLLTLYEHRAFTFLVLFGLAYAYLAGAHVRIDVLRERFAPRTRAWIEIAGGVVALLPLCVVIVAFHLPFVHQAYLAGEPAWILLGLPLGWLVKAMLPLAFFLLGLAGITVMTRNALFLAGRGPDPDMARAPAPP